MAIQQEIFTNPLQLEGESSEKIKLESRRYIGSKAKLTNWIMDTIADETENIHSFMDVFSGTASVANRAMEKYSKVIVNDVLFSNNIIYKAFFKNQNWDRDKIDALIEKYNNQDEGELIENYFSINFGGKFFEHSIAKKIGFIREDIEQRKFELNEKEYAILLTTLIYNIDKLANTVGHFDAYIKKPIQKRRLFLRAIQTAEFSDLEIYQKDANKLAREVNADIAYIDPPYNSRQYSRFYHIYENLVQWKKPKLYGVALKPEPENMSKYCTVKAKDAFKDLVENLDVKYLAVSYNNTYKSKSKSSKNKIQLEEIIDILNSVGKTKIFEKSHKYFNTGKTDFNNHKEFLFLTKKYE